MKTEEAKQQKKKAQGMDLQNTEEHNRAENKTKERERSTRQNRKEGGKEGGKQEENTIRTSAKAKGKSR